MLYSECCGEMVYDDYDICSECLDHCDTYEEWDDEEAEMACQKAICLNPSLFKYHFLLATIYIRQKKIKGIEKYF